MSNEVHNNCKIICTLPNAGDEINGIEFEPENGAMVAYNVPEDEAEKFSSIPGYAVEPQQGSGAIGAEVIDSDLEDEDLSDGGLGSDSANPEDADLGSGSTGAAPEDDGAGADLTGAKDDSSTGSDDVTGEGGEGKEGAGDGSQDDASSSNGDKEKVKLEDMKANEVIAMLKQQPDSWPVVLTAEELRPAEKQRQGVLKAIASAKESLEGK